MRRRTLSRHAQCLGLVLLVGFVLNYAWEIAQMPAYADGDGQPFPASLRFAAGHCFVPTLGDIVVVGGTFMLGWALRRRADWIHAMTWRDTAVITLLLVALAVGIELVLVHTLGRWTYTTRMPMLPVVNVGLLPTLQLALLTPLTFVIVDRIMTRLGTQNPSV